ncbi:MAG TPA: type II toxin-antitoxin system VapC family toxin [Nitrososphaera sp.]|nr:type II toxin-antitoxin system VapC family toxin [Nitrososphaera sp.]
MERSKKVGAAVVVVVVADASVIVKWFVDEEYTKKALELRQGYIDGKVDIACPSLLPYEVLNALRYNPEFGEEQARIASDALEKYQLRLYPILGEMASLCIKNSFAHGISLYDSSYVSLAEYLGVPLYTADEKILVRARGAREEGEEGEEGGAGNIKHISAFEA